MERVSNFERSGESALPTCAAVCSTEMQPNLTHVFQICLLPERDCARVIRIQHYSISVKIKCCKALKERFPLPPEDKQNRASIFVRESDG